MVSGIRQGRWPPHQIDFTGDNKQWHMHYLTLFGEIYRFPAHLKLCAIKYKLLDNSVWLRRSLWIGEAT
jgi:hypothetical protein